MHQVAGGTANRQNVTDRQHAIRRGDDARNAHIGDQRLVLAGGVDDGGLEFDASKLAATLGHRLEGIRFDQHRASGFLGLLTSLGTSGQLALKFHALFGQFASLDGQLFHGRFGVGFHFLGGCDFAISLFHPRFQFLGGSQQGALGFSQGFDFVDVRHDDPFKESEQIADSQR